jgi:rod shape-determining protein MreC
VTPSRLTAVLVLTPQRVTQGTGNVWGAGVGLSVNADSATKRIAAAGDSIARQAALLEARARAAALDSVRRATIDSVRRALGAPPDSTALRPGAPTTPAATPATGVRPAATDSTHARRPVVPRRDSVRTDTMTVMRSTPHP